MALGSALLGPLQSRLHRVRPRVCELTALGVGVSDFQAQTPVMQPALSHFLFCRQPNLHFSLFSGLGLAILTWTEVPNLPGLCCHSCSLLLPLHPPLQH